MHEKMILSRRQFLRCAALTAAATAPVLLMPGCLSPKRITDDPNYYLNNRERLLKNFDKDLQALRYVMNKELAEKDTDQYLKETMKVFSDLIPQLPYIGGDANTLTSTLVESSGVLALYQVLKARGFPVEKIGEFIYRSMEAGTVADPISAAQAKTGGTKEMEKGFASMAVRAQKRQYPEDWVLSMVPGNADFDFGVDYTECALCKLFPKYGAMDVLPYLCLGDFPPSRLFDSGLVRTQTLARGGSCCDFRYKRGRSIQMEWTPAFLKAG